ncbi:translation initiation factor IF-2 [Bacteriovoracaceae bacterium]|nr:translation initiation factor IF-2 [Bacteriovoracaceae bacterium]
MSKKVFELANEFGIGAIDLVGKLNAIGLTVKNHMVLLSEDDIAKAMSELGLGADEKKVTKKKVTKKKVTKKTSSKEKVIKKKVIKKVAKPAAAVTAETEEAPAELVVTEPKVDASENLEAAEVVVEKKTKVIKRTADDIKKKAEEAVEAKAIAAKALDENPVFKEKMHSFTPIFTPPEEKKTEKTTATTTTSSNTASSSEARPVGRSVPGEVPADDKKKRLGGLAALVTKKAAAGKTKDLTMIRAQEEMKFASGVLGRTIYTPAKRKRIYSGPSRSTILTEVKDAKRNILLHKGGTAEEISNKLSQKFSDVADKCLELNLLIKEEDYIGIKLAEKIAALYSYRVEDKAFKEEQTFTADKPKDDSPLRNPIITIMGHVDHGKTTLLDYIRNEKVADGEAGGITQHIGAYSVEKDGATLTFLDTPGHAAFGSMRQRGADITDIVVLVVAADDGVMPQTKESIKYARNATSPIIVAVNKMDKEGASSEKIKQDLMQYEIISDEWGGDTQIVEISALKGDGVDDLLEAIKIQAEMMELRAPAKGGAEGVVIESKIETGRGPVATVLIERGTLKKGDSIVVGETYGRARSLMDYRSKEHKGVGPSTPIQILGLNGVASPGDTLNVVKNEREAKKVVENRITERKALAEAGKKQVRNIDDFFSDVIESAEKKVLNLIVRSDVQGSYEAICNSLEALGNDEVSVSVIGGGVGAITDSDVNLADSADGYILGFNMRPVTSARKLSEQLGVEVKNYSIIYKLIDEITAALEGMLDPEFIEIYIGRAEVKDTFTIPKIGTIAGSSVIDGKIAKGCNIRLLREGKIIFDGKLSSLKRFKDDVKEVKNGYECGVGLEGFDDVKVEDIFEAYMMEEKKRKLEPSSTVL